MCDSSKDLNIYMKIFYVENKLFLKKETKKRKLVVKYQRRNPKRNLEIEIA